MKFTDRVKLSELCQLSFGQHIQSGTGGSIKYLQVKNFSEEGLFLDNVESFVEESQVKASSILNDGDIIFVSKGMKFFAYKYESKIGKSIASSVFYVLKVDKNLILPDFLISVLNHPKSLSYFYGVSAGSSIPSIRKRELMDFEFNLPSFQEQKKITDIYECHQKEMNLLSRIKENKQLIFNQLIYNLIK